MSNRIGFTGLPTTASTRDIVTMVNALNQGRSNNTGTVTLSPSSTTTVVQDSRAGSESVILLIPMTASAAAAQPATYISSRAKQSFTLTHTSDPSNDRLFSYVVIG